MMHSMLSMPSLHANVRAHRTRKGWSQAELGERAGISRQGLAAIETGRSVPSTEVALRLARALGVPVDALFQLVDKDPSVVAVEWSGLGAPLPSRVRLATVGGRTLAYGLSSDDSRAGRCADGLGERRPDGTVRVRPLPSTPPRPDLVVAGCDPAFGLVKEHLLRERGIEVLWLSAGSRAALDALGRGVIHVAGVHLRDRDTGTYNGPWVQRLVPFRATRLGFSVWEQALLLPPGNPLGIRGIRDLAQPAVRFVNREPGSGSRSLVELEMAKQGIPGGEIPGFADTAAHTHAEVAAAIAARTANAGVAIRSLAAGYGLGAVPLAQEPYELVVPDHFLELPGVQALLDALRRPELRHQVEALGGYDAAGMGRPV
jgi:putative molybdopterin biosynthesis protein